MSMRPEAIAEEALALPIEARALLADRLVESLDPSEETPIRELWVAEATRRREEIKSGQVRAVPAKQAISEVRSSIQG